MIQQTYIMHTTTGTATVACMKSCRKPVSPIGGFSEER